MAGCCVVVVVDLVTDVTLLPGVVVSVLSSAPPLPVCWTNGAGGGGCVDADVDVTVAIVARTVATTTPEPARMTSDLDFQRSSPGSVGANSGPVGSVTAISLRGPTPTSG